MFFRSKKRKIGSVSRVVPRFLPKERKHILKIHKRNRRFFIKNYNGAPSKFSKFKTYALFTGILTIVGFILYLFVFSNIFLIKTINVVYAGDEIYENSENLLKDIDIIRNKNLLSLDKAEVGYKILENHPDISDLDIKKVFPNTIDIKYDKYPIIANVINIDSENNEQKFLINKIGMIVASNDENTNLPYIRDFSNENFEPNSIIIEEKKVEYILKSIQLFEDKFGMKLFEAKYYPIEREVHLKTDKNFDVWIDMTKDLEEQLKKLKAALPKLNIYTESLEYIDLRIFSTTGDRVDFKRR